MEMVAASVLEVKGDGEISFGEGTVHKAVNPAREEPKTNSNSDTPILIFDDNKRLINMEKVKEVQPEL